METFGFIEPELGCNACRWTPGGYKVLLTGTNKLNGKYKIWNINKKGQIVRSSRWRSRDWAIRAGWEQIFGDVIDRDGAIGQADDYSNDVHTTGVIKIGRTNSGELETKTDRDWFAVQLKGGYRYEFELVGESLRDPFLNLRSDEGNVLAYDDNQNDLNSRIVYWFMTVNIFLMRVHTRTLHRNIQNSAQPVALLNQFLRWWTWSCWCQECLWAVTWYLHTRSIKLWGSL